MKSLVQILRPVLRVLVVLIFMVCALFWEQSSHDAYAAIKSQEGVWVRVSDGRFAQLTSLQGVQTLFADQLLVSGDFIENTEEDFLELTIGKDALLRLAPNTLVQVLETQERRTVFSLIDGEVWLNTVNSAEPIELAVGPVLFIPQRVIMDVDHDDAVRTWILQGTVEVGLLPQLDAVKTFLDVDSPLLVNRFLMASGNSAVFYADQILQNTDTFAQLLYSKLVKEFQYGVFDQNFLREDPWFVLNIGLDDQLVRDLEMKNRENIQNLTALSRSQGVVVNMEKAFSHALQPLVFDQEKKAARQIQQIFSYLDDAEYLLLFAREAEATTNLREFSQQFLAQFSLLDENGKVVLNKNVDQYYQRLLYVLADHPLFSVKKTLVDLQLQQPLTSRQELRRAIMFLRDYLRSADLLASANFSAAKNSLENYFNGIKKMAALPKTFLLQNADVWAEENQLFENTLKFHPQYYQDGFFEMKRFLEQTWLNLLSDGESKREEVQTLISTKIDFLKQIREYYLAEQVSLLDTKTLVKRLISEIRELDDQSAVGFRELFRLRLEDYGNFLLFLNSSQTQSGRGESLRTRYDSFVISQYTPVDLDEAIEQFTSDKPVDINLPETQEVLDVPAMNELEATPDAGVQSEIPSDRQMAVIKTLLIKQMKDNGMIVRSDAIEVQDYGHKRYRISSAHLVNDPDVNFHFSYDQQKDSVSLVSFDINGASQSVSGGVHLAQLAEVMMQAYDNYQP